MSDDGMLHSESLPVSRISSWCSLSRWPFLLVGILPYLLGAVIALRRNGMLAWGISGWGCMGVVLVMLSAYYAGEYWDVEEDTIGRKMGVTRFSGGSGMIPMGRIDRDSAFRASILTLALALCIACLLRFVCGTGVLTIPLALVGLIGGLFYSSPPVRWVSRGVGELWIALCYGWLPVATGYYLQTGELAPEIHLASLPIAFSIFTVILLNEFPDYHADLITGKANLLVRAGHRRALALYTLAAALGWISLVIAAVWCAIPLSIPISIPFLAISIAVVHRLRSGDWRHADRLDRLCGANILVNLGISASLIGGLLL